MTFLPIVDRELRVAARRKSTYRIRAWTAVIALAIGLCLYLPILMGVGPPGSPGKSLYAALTAFNYLLCLLAGVLLTADCLSEEKREGTLGLLFLTDLRGHDVVLGKFMAMWLNAFYGLMAVLPITGLCLLMGGLTAGEFWRTNLALINTLFFSMAAGVLVSAFGRNPQWSMGGTLGLVILVAGVLPGLASLGARLRLPAVCLSMEWISPLCPFSHALEPAYLGQPEKYWWALAASQLFGWALLALASLALPHRWQERAARVSRPVAAKSGPSPRAGAHEELLQTNPVLWMMAGEGGLRRIAWFTVGAWALVINLTTWFSDRTQGLAPVGLPWTGPYGVGIFGFILKWLLALQACRFFVDARRNGGLEMLLCTPLSSQDIIRGQVLGLRRSFQWPLIGLLLLTFLPPAVQLVEAPTWSSAEAAQGFAGIALTGVYCLRMVADCYAVAALGMWLALSLRKPGLAPSLTILFVLILPSALCWLDIFADLFFILWGMSKLKQVDLRALLAQEYQPVLGQSHA